MRREEFSKNATGNLVPIFEDGAELIAFVPHPIPREMILPSSIIKLCERASLQLGRLFGAGDILSPWLQLFLTREAIASNAIEGTITTARELYLFKVEGMQESKKQPTSDRQEVLNYIKAMIKGVELLELRPISLNLINELHGVLLERVRGQDKFPGQIRKRQNAISKNKFFDARFIPPPASEVLPSISDLEQFIHEDSDIPDLVRAALVHYQFEAIHPYLDGNGRLGRLLIPLLLISWGMLPKGMPRLYLSSYFERNDPEYRDRLLSVSQNGEWNKWIEFFLESILTESQRTLDKANDLIELRDKYIEMVKRGPGNLQVIIRQLFDSPVIRLADIVSVTKVSRQQAGNYAKKLAELGILSSDDSTWRQHFFADEILQVFFEES